MELKEYLDKYRISPVEFAVRIKMSPATVYQILSKRAVPHKKTAIKIQKETDGLVTLQDLRGKDENRL